MSGQTRRKAGTQSLRPTARATVAGAAEASLASQVVAEPTYHLAPVFPPAPMSVDAPGSSESAAMPPQVSLIPSSLQDEPTLRLKVDEIELSAEANNQPNGLTPQTAVTYSPAQIRAAYGLLFPLLAGYRAVAYGIFRLHSQAATQALQEVDQLQATLDTAQRGELAARIQLTATHQQRSLLEAMTRSLASESRLDQAARYLFELLQGSGSYTSLALLTRDREGWTAVACQSPLAKRMENSRLLNLREPLWDLAAQSRTAQLVRQDAADRIFVGELAGLAIPMGQFLLYLGRSAPALNEKESQWAMWVAETSTPLLEATERRQRQSQVLAQSQAHSQLLQGQVTALSGLLEASRLLTSSLERASLLGLVEQACKVVFPNTSGSLWLRPEKAERSWGIERVDCGAERIGRAVQTSRLWVEGRQMLQPLVSFPGALVLQWPTGQAPEEDRQCHEQLALLAYSVGLALCNADYLRQVVEAQAELVQKSKMAAVGQLAAGVAHELNSPLGAIALSLTTLASSLTEARAQRTLDRASRSAQRCQTIIQKLFIYTRLGTARQEKLSLETMVDDALAFFRGQELPANTELEMLVHQPAEIFGMSHDLHEMLKNLILNAVESYRSDSPNPRVQVACGQDGNWAMLAVRDWGTGMEANTLERACEPFFTTKTIGTNVGLGLSVSREIARQHGGELSLQSSPGEGCLVTVRLPLQVQSA